MSKGVEPVVTTEAQQQYYAVVKLIACVRKKLLGVSNNLIVGISKQGAMVALAATIVVT